MLSNYISSLALLAFLLGPVRSQHLDISPEDFSQNTQSDQSDYNQVPVSYHGPEIFDDFGWNARVWCNELSRPWIKESEEWQPTSMPNSDVLGSVIPAERAKWKKCLEENLAVGIGPYGTDAQNQPSPQSAQPIEPESTKGSAVLPIEIGTIGGNPYFFTNLALGTPPQPFRAVLDLTTNGLYVRSASCPSEDCGPPDFSYNGSLSETASSRGSRFKVLPDGWVVLGNVSEDTLHLVGVKVPDMEFGEIDRYHGENLYYYVLSYVVDGAIGLGPPNSHMNNYPPYYAPNLLHRLFTSKVTDRKTFTLSIPGQVGEQGALTIGSFPKGYSPGTARVPLPSPRIPTPESFPHLSVPEIWILPLTSVAFSGSVNLNVTFEPKYVQLDFRQVIGIPTSTVYKFYKAIGARPSRTYEGALIDCDKRDALPDLVLGLGRHDVVLTKEEYSFERKVFGRPFCIVNIVPSDKVATIGVLVMRKLDLVFDLEANELGMMPRT